MSLQATRADRESTSIGVDSSLLAVYIALLGIGMVMVYSSTIAMDTSMTSSNTEYFSRQFLHLLLGLGLSVLVASIPIRYWQSLSIPLLVLSLISLLLVLLLGEQINGSRRWLQLAGFRFQPAEMTKLCVILYAASYLTRKQSQLHSFTHGILNIGAVLAVIGGLMLLQPDFGSFFVITSVVGLMMFLGGIRISHTLFCLSLAVMVMVALVAISDYRMQRMLSFVDPWSDPFDSGFQLTQALIAVGRGEIFGVGLGASIQKLYYLPHANNDFILAVIGEELGFAGILLVIALFSILLHRAMIIARRAEMVGKVYAARVAQGVGILLSYQAIINIGVNLGLLPTKGLTLPFISYGGSSMLVCCSAIGLLFAVDRQARQRQTR